MATDLPAPTSGASDAWRMHIRPGRDRGLAGEPACGRPAPGRNRRMTPTSMRNALCFLAIAFATSGCQHAMPSSNTPDRATYRIVPNEFPLRFKTHDFEVMAYNTIGCHVLYAHTVEEDDGPDEVTPPPPSADYREHWGFASHVGIRNFPPPAVVTWKSLDGVPHEARVDIGEIFKDERVLHHVPQDELPLETAAMGGDPSIFLEVNDRTITVATKAMIFLKGNPTGPSEFKDDLIIAWSHTY